MGVMFDTSVLIEAERGRFDTGGFIAGKEKEPFGLSAISVAELLHGVYRADTEERGLKRSAFVEKVIELFPIYPFDENAARIYARLWSQLIQKVHNIGAHDLMISATAISLGFSVATFNVRHFSKIEGLDLEVL